jgi:tetratricopeptide (TPR) repeat protein
MLGNYSKALENFRKAEIFETNRLWSIKKIIYCNRKLKDIDEALYWCTEALKIAPEDVYLHTMSGNCYLDKKLFEQALDHYFRVEFLAPENRKVIRPISWCLFVQNKLEMARDYMSRILEGDPMSHDYINAGHLELCLNNKPRAIEYYVQALKSSEISLNKFSEVLEFDREYLVSNGVDPIEIQFVIDYMQYV